MMVVMIDDKDSPVDAGQNCPATMTPLYATVTDVRALDGYRLESAFSDGVQGVVDLSKRIVGRGGVFEPLEQPQFFRQARVTESSTVQPSLQDGVGQVYPILPSDESQGYCQPTLRVEITAGLTTFGFKDMGNAEA
jgi:hypothetical protein